MRVAEIMTRDVHFLSPDASVQQAARLMAELDVGALPVGEAADLRGILTDRDVLIRVVAQGRDPATTPVAAVMSSDVLTCTGEEPVEAVLLRMESRQVRRVPVLEEGRVVGMLGARAILAVAGKAAADDGGPGGRGPLR
ncbi:CBS domain-containing protein [Rhodospirillum centenum]|uniref:CBS domain protein n=1 Tax=Rhodospirillum centenum (strain ATCC 51521 / SW) TaxID=414684 RepID=B6IWD7_RHOCS|nr:CBS domain-containing protein [Rhodospirillum centenum]ACJ00611.1 CBS domain protein [Rhodospirillum centenum SW]